ncbi:MAG: nickel pincer cofactor biosynthesis protein LarC [Pirellulaceae bacterium]|nr:nickel pincer cofactor biosynthesis protein LarC [Pirellulaceae bacterium]
MKLAYLDCPSGISGDMTLGALVDAGIELAAIQAGIDSLGFPNIKLVAEETKRKGFRACKVKVVHEPEHAHRHLHHITEKIDASTVLSPPQKDLAKRIFTCIGEAEAKVHGTTLRKVHFHEVGAVDSIADIVGAAVGLSLLGVDRIVCSPVPTGTGYIEIEHGRVSVPAPATAEILRGVPLAPSVVACELTTPTGAAIVKTVADEFGPLPAMTIDTIGLGAGDRDMKEQANILRLIVGRAGDGLVSDQIWVLETNLDDISGEVIGHTTGRLFEAGALDVYTTSIQMKKNRPGVLLSVLCPVELIAKLEKIIFKETSTLGIRRWQACRHKLDRRPYKVESAHGPIEGKLAVLPDGSVSFSPEFEACRKIATEKNVPLKDVYEAAVRAFGEGTGS